MGSDWDIELREQLAHDAKMARREAFPAKVEAAVKAAIKLAIFRNDLADQEGEPVASTDDGMQAIADDTWDAMNGKGTCAATVIEELQALLDLCRYIE